MILGIVIGFAALAAISSVIGGSEAETPDPGTDAGKEWLFGPHSDELILGQDRDNAPTDETHRTP